MWYTPTEKNFQENPSRQLCFVKPLQHHVRLKSPVSILFNQYFIST